MRPSSERIPAVDYIKATAITAVVITHAGQSPWLPDAGALDRLLRGTLVQFHVPAFLVVAGFLAARQSEFESSWLHKRLKRLLIPYLVASLCVFIAGITRPDDFVAAILMLGTGSAMSIYYFVFDMCIALVLTAVLRRIGANAPAYALIAFLVWWAVRPLVVHPLPVPLGTPSFWFFRNPTWFYPYFLAGWLARSHWPSLRAVLEPHRKSLLVAALVTVALYVAGIERFRGTPFALPAQAIYVLAVITVVCIATERAVTRQSVRFLSEASYTIYLYHLFFMTPALAGAQELPPAVRILVLTGLGLAGGSAVTLIGRAVLGSRSRVLLGA